jgi:iron complex transport system substrate-binding protein
MQVYKEEKELNTKKWSILFINIIFGCSLLFKVESKQITVIDDYKRVIILKRYPQRIISLSPSNTEILCAIGALDKIVGVTKFCDYPKEVIKAKREKRIEVIGGFGPKSLDIEKIITLKPDLLLGNAIYTKQDIQRLEARTNAAFFCLNPKNLEEVLENIKKIGQLVGKEKQAINLINKLKKRISSVTCKIKKLPLEKKPKVFHLVFINSGIWTAFRGTFQDDIITKAGGINITHLIRRVKEKKGWGKIELEELIKANPEVIIYDTHAKNVYKWLKTEKRLRNIQAIKENRVYKIDACFISRPGPRLIKALELYAKFIHPEIF